MSEAVIQTLVTDRTYTDVVHWRTLRDKGYANMTDDERTEWDGAQMKGAYNPPNDMNRVGVVLNYLRDKLNEAGYLPDNSFTAKTDWTADDIPTVADLTYYLECVSTIRAAFPTFSATPAAPKYSGGLDHQEANNIEKILLDIHQLLTNAQAAYCYCGELYSGEI